MSRVPGRPAPAPLVEWVAYLREIGVRELHVPSAEVAWRGSSASEMRPTSKKQAAPRAAPVVAPRVAPDPQGDADAQQRLIAIRKDLGDCKRCKLHGGRTHIVFGVGNPNARLVFVGEGPGANEDEQGEPFVGRAGQKLDQMIQSVKLTRDQVYIANIVKCRPPNNRDPEPDEIETCSPFLAAQIDAIRPRVIVTLGAPATRLLLETKIGITKLRGEWHEYRGIPVMPTFHPAYVLRNYTREIRQKVWDDFKSARARAYD